MISIPGVLCAPGPSLHSADEAHNPPAALSQHGAEHNADQPGQTEPDGLHPGLAQILPGELGFFLWHSFCARTFPSCSVTPALVSPQAAIVAEAYEFVPDWAEVLYQQVIAKGDFTYLEEFKQQRPLKPGVFEEIAKK